MNQSYVLQKPSLECDNYGKPTREDIDSLKVIDNMSFKIGAQLYSKINRIILIYIYMRMKKGNEKMKP